MPRYLSLVLATLLLGCAGPPSNNPHPFPTAAAPSQPTPTPERVGFKVPTEIEPGLYRATTDDPDCYWTLGDSSGDGAGIHTVRISPTDKAFIPDDCGPWERLD